MPARALLAVVVVFLGVSAAAARIEDSLARTKREIAPLDFSRTAPYSRPTQEYFRYYGLEFSGARHLFGSFRSQGFTLAAHVFIPERPRATVILLHGYYDHSGTYRGIIAQLLSAGYAVAIYDMPGHGLSSGEPVSISDFAKYVAILGDFIALCRARLPGPRHLIGHSVGAGIAADYLLTKDAGGIDRTVLVAPLMHCCLWDMVRIGDFAMGWIFKSVPRATKPSPPPQELADIVRYQDPLEARIVSMDWVRALVEWNRRMEAYPPSSREVLILSGTKDRVVDWKYNKKFLTMKFPRARVAMLDGANHKLLGEGDPYRRRAFEAILRYLETPP